MMKASLEVAKESNTMITIKEKYLNLYKEDIGKFRKK